MSNKIGFSLKLNPGEREEIQEIAFSLGIARTTGVNIGKVGSITGLLRAIISGEVRLSKEDISIPSRSSSEDRFWTRVNKNGKLILDTPCWEWTGFTHPLPRNYGMFTVKKRHTVRTHRFSWELHYGPIPDDLYVCHSCDNPPCVNPNHLFLGTPLDNAHDMAVKKRAIAPKGENSPHAKLTWDKVNEIRFRYANSKVTQRQLAKEYNVHQATIQVVLKGETWKVQA